MKNVNLTVKIVAQIQLLLEMAIATLKILFRCVTMTQETVAVLEMENVIQMVFIGCVTLNRNGKTALVTIRI